MCGCSCSKEMRERDFLKSNLSQNLMKIRARIVRGSESESERVSMRASHPLLGLYLKETWSMHIRSSWPQRSCSRWGRWRPGAVGPGSTDLWGRPAPGWTPWCPPWARFLCNGHKFWKSSACSELCSKRCSNNFPKDFETQKIFVVFFCKKREVLEKFQHA